VTLLSATALVAAAGLIACSSDPEAKPKPRARVLVFSKTAGFRHDSIPAGTAANQEPRSVQRLLGHRNRESHGLRPQEPAPLRRRRLPQHHRGRAGTRQQKAFKSYIRRGGGWAGIHSAADTEYEWPFYGRLLGAYFQSHPAVQPASIGVTDRSHPSTKALPARWTRTDEWYSFARNPRGSVHVLATLDESTYSGGTVGADHPIVWCHPFKGGRAWYTAGGHTIESYAEPDFRWQLLGGILWAAGLATGDCRI